MPPIRDDERHLNTMRHEINQYLNGTQTLSGLIDVLNASIRALSDCPRDLIERMGEELRVMEEINGMARKGSLRVPEPREHRMLQDALGAIERLTSVARSVVEAKNAGRLTR